MLQTRALRAAQGYVPLIKFKGQHSPPASLDHTPTAHPASPTHILPDSFAAYRQKATQFGPLGRNSNLQPSSSSSRTTSSSSSPSQPSPPSSSSTSSPSAGPTHISAAGRSQLAYGNIGGRSGRELGAVEAPRGWAFDRSELPPRFGRLSWSPEEVEAVESGGASLVG